jgi:hypothetical protein
MAYLSQEHIEHLSDFQLVKNSRVPLSPKASMSFGDSLPQIVNHLFITLHSPSSILHRLSRQRRSRSGTHIHIHIYIYIYIHKLVYLCSSRTTSGDQQYLTPGQDRMVRGMLNDRQVINHVM